MQKVNMSAWVEGRREFVKLQVGLKVRTGRRRHENKNRINSGNTSGGARNSEKARTEKGKVGRHEALEHGL